MKQTEKITTTSGLRIKNSLIKSWINQAIEQGFEVRRSTSNHIIITNPTTGAFAPLTTTKVEGRSLLNYRSSIRKIGLQVD